MAVVAPGGNTSCSETGITSEKSLGAVVDGSVMVRLVTGNAEVFFADVTPVTPDGGAWPETGKPLLVKVPLASENSCFDTATPTIPGRTV